MFEDVVMAAAARQRELLLPDRRQLLVHEARRGLGRHSVPVEDVMLISAAAGLISRGWGLPGVVVIGALVLPAAFAVGVRTFPVLARARRVWSADGARTGGWAVQDR